MAAEAGGDVRLGPFRGLGRRFEIVTDIDPLAAWLAAALGGLRTGPGHLDLSYAVREAGGGRFELAADGRVVGTPVEAGAVLPSLFSRLNPLVARSHEHLVVHGAVAARDGLAVVLSGPSGAGKSTLVAALTREGYSYGGDEHAALRHDDRRVDPFPKPLALKPGSAGLFLDESPGRRDAVAQFHSRQLFLEPDGLGSGVLDTPAEVGQVVFPSYVRGAPVAIDVVSRAEGVWLLREESFNFRDAPRRSFDALVAVARRVTFTRITFGDAAEAARALARHTP